MRALETAIPPPVVMTLAGAAAWAISRLAPAMSFQLPGREVLTLLLALVGLSLNLYPKVLFQRAGTTVNPLRPNTTSGLVTGGIYRYSRNPMYLGQAILVLAWALWLHNFVSLLAVPAFVLYISRFQILPEERALASKFPAGYAAFRKQARRWL